MLRLGVLFSRRWRGRLDRFPSQTQFRQLRQLIFLTRAVVRLHVPHQLIHRRRIQKTLRRLGVWIFGERFSLERQQARDLVFFPLLLMHAHALARGPRIETPTIQRDRDQLRRWLGRRLPPMMHVVLRGLIALRRHLRADFLGQTIDVPAADREFTHQLENRCR